MEKFKSNLDMFFDDAVKYLTSFSQKTLNITAIVVLHCTFFPSVLAYYNSITDKVPNLDSVLIVLFALTVMALNSIIRKDMLAITVHILGFVTQCVLLSMVLFK